MVMLIILIMILGYTEASIVSEGMDFIIELVPEEYNVTVINGTASVGDTTITSASKGAIVTLTADAAPEGKVFNKWIVNGMTVSDENSAITTFEMPRGAVTAEATYKLHICDIQFVKKIEPTCSADGKDEYYKCEGCGKFYEDKEGTIEIVDIDSWDYLEKRTHNPSNWKYNEEGHWKECAYENCGIVIEIISDHKYDNHVDINCNICGYVRNITFTGWQQVGGNWYYLESSGVMVANRWVGNYYLQSDGTMARNKWIGKYYVGADGCWVA